MDIFAETYPEAPGWKAEGTSRDAAEAIAPRAGNLCDRVLACLQRKAMTPEEVAKQLKEPVHSIRPRFSQLSAQNLIVKAGERRRAMGGRMAEAWVAVMSGSLAGAHAPSRAEQSNPADGSR